MVLISNVAKAFLLPPGSIILALLVIIFFVPRRGKIFLGIITALLYAFSISPVADLLLRPLEDAHPPLLPSALVKTLKSWIVLRLLSFWAAEQYKIRLKQERGGILLEQVP